MACREWAVFPFVLGLGIHLVAHILGPEQRGIAPEGSGLELEPARLLGVVLLQRPPQRQENRY
mgnify:CR=1 FL=1